MKQYKPMYGSSLIHAALVFSLIFLPIMPFLDIIFAIRGDAQFGSIFFLGIAIFLSLILAAALFALLIAGIGMLFSRKATICRETTVYHDGYTLPIQGIRYITLYLPDMDRKYPKPLRLTLWADNTHYCTITRPSPALIRHLRTNCPQAKFEVDDIRGQIKFCLIGSLVAALVLIISFIAEK